MDQLIQAEPTGSRAGPEQRLLSALPPGWRAVGRCRLGIGGGPLGVGMGCHALAHPTVGLALIDLVPHATPNAEARLRRALEAAGFPERHPGTLPVWHGRVDPMQLRTLSSQLAEGFDSLPPLGLGGPEGWIGAVQGALARDPAWEVPGRPRAAAAAAAPAVPDEAEEAALPAPRRPLARWIGGGMILACLLAIGIALLPAAPAPSLAPPVASSPAPAVPPVAAAPALAPAPAPVVAALPAPAPTLAPTPPAAQGLPPLERVELPVIRPAEPPPAPAPAPAPVQTSVQAPVQAAEPPPPAAMDEQGPPLATPPPAPPLPPVRQAAARPRIDPSCSRALFRFQQGERLTAAEESFVKTGCVTRR